MDGCPQSHDASRRYADGTGSAAEILKDWSWVVENVKSINFVLTEKNVYLFSKSMIFLNSFYKKKILLLLENEGLAFDEQWLKTYLEQIEIIKQWHKNTKIQNTLALGWTEFGPCTMCEDLELAIHPSGDITPCWTLGDVEEFSLGNINFPETLKVDTYRPCQVTEKYREKLEGFHGRRCLSRTVYGLKQLEREGKILKPKVFNAILDGLGDLCKFLNELGLNEIGQNYNKAIEEERRRHINLRAKD
jgi:radical SAM protein with 4Fe4S-binding SPASM domain